jgi:membrane-bound ClpP family serine protease
MPFITIFIGIDLIFLGIVGLFVSSSDGKFSYTALIPSAWGVLLVVLGILAFKASMKKHAMHLAALLGVIGTVAPMVMAIKTLAAGNPKATAAPYFQITMALFCAAFVAMCVKSFIDARKARKAAEALK